MASVPHQTSLQGPWVLFSTLNRALTFRRLDRSSLLHQIRLAHHLLSLFFARLSLPPLAHLCFSASQSLLTDRQHETLVLVGRREFLLFLPKD